MANIIVAFSRPEDGKKHKGILVRGAVMIVAAVWIRIPGSFCRRGSKWRDTGSVVPV